MMQPHRVLACPGTSSPFDWLGRRGLTSSRTNAIAPRTIGSGCLELPDDVAAPRPVQRDRCRRHAYFHPCRTDRRANAGASPCSISRHAVGFIPTMNCAVDQRWWQSTCVGSPAEAPVSASGFARSSDLIRHLRHPIASRLNGTPPPAPADAIKPPSAGPAGRPLLLSNSAL